jgi:hypothetical protein
MLKTFEKDGFGVVLNEMSFSLTTSSLAVELNWVLTLGIVVLAKNYPPPRNLDKKSGLSNQWADNIH